MNFKILLVKTDVNDATREYINVIKDAVTKSYGVKNIPCVNSIKEIKEEDILIIISLQALVHYKLLFKPKQKFIFWFQGITPEEIVFLYSGLYTRIKSIFYTQIEKYVLKKAKLIFFVSEKQRQHYNNKYGYKKNNYIVMPCFNKNMDESSFTASKYEKPSFVFAGQMARWQCIEETLLLFLKIKVRLPKAELIILTPDQEDIRKLLEKYDISAEMKYIPLKDLSHEMAKYKYGFLLRDKILINEVATPTKMNSYMANGVIPIFSNVIGDFRNVFLTLKYVVACENNEPDRIVDQILKIENETIVLNEII
ncbi:hypothetical protein LJC52_04665, partial [Bacteroidales bacterium OttesenSCG-928-A17]|nr:hypothetical protein [Bacteroidales bacterium OttesenSCG-928-A17]